MEEEFDFTTTKEIFVPSDLFDQIIGQPEAVQLAKIAAKQKRNLLLIGPPGIGKSMIAQAIASYFCPPTQEIMVLHNPQKPERPILEIRMREQIEAKKNFDKKTQRKILLKPQQVPSFVSQRLGYSCKFCGFYSSPEEEICPSCYKEKFKKIYPGPFEDILSLSSNKREDKVFSSRIVDNKEELVVFKRFNNELIELMEVSSFSDDKNFFEPNIIVPLNRKLFVQATGASKTELLGDVRHDPYGGHHQIGIPPYQRVIPGAIHEAHEGVLFIDELVSLGHLQRYLLTAMQEKTFQIAGRNSSSTGSSVKVDKVPCDFILISAINLSDLPKIMPQLRSRIIGNGYEIILNSVMEDTPKNRKFFAQFVAQEIKKDGKIPHVSVETVKELINFARYRAKTIDKQSGISLRLRTIAGIIKAAGDIANYNSSQLIEKEHVLEAIAKRKGAEEQIQKKYGSFYKAYLSDFDYETSPSSGKDIN